VPSALTPPFFAVLRGRYGVALVIGVAPLVAAVTVVVIWQMRDAGRRVTAHFIRTVGIYPGSDVRILGVKVGDVVDVVPEGRTVKVVMEYDADYRVPGSAKAVIVPPSLVSDRYVQLSPAYRSGATLPDNTDLPLSRTVAPLELDETAKAIDEIASTLGPGGANSTGELSRLLKVGRKNLEGNGEQLGQTLNDLVAALQTVSAGRHDLFGTIDNLQASSEVLAESDKEVRRFNGQLADVSEQLADERQELSAALKNVASALGQVTRFVKDNRKELLDDVDALTDVSAALVRQRKALIDVVDIAPVGALDASLAYNAKSGTVDSRPNLMSPYDAAAYVCSLMVHALPVKEIPQQCVDLAKRLHDAGATLNPELAKLLGLSLPAPGGDSGSNNDKGAPQPPSGEIDGMDPSFGGILGGS